MGKIERRLSELGYELPCSFPVPPAMKSMFRMVRIVGDRCIISGHGPLAIDGSLAAPLGKVGTDLDVEQGAQAAHLTALAMVSTLKSELGSLDRVTAWVRVFGMVNSGPEFDQHTQVINGFSKTISEIFGLEVGSHTRSAVGMAGLPFNMPVEVEAEVQIK